MCRRDTCVRWEYVCTREDTCVRNRERGCEVRSRVSGTGYVSGTVTSSREFKREWSESEGRYRWGTEVGVGGGPIEDTTNTKRSRVAFQGRSVVGGGCGSRVSSAVVWETRGLS